MSIPNVGKRKVRTTHPRVVTDAPTKVSAASCPDARTKLPRRGVILLLCLVFSAACQDGLGGEPAAGDAQRAGGKISELRISREPRLQIGVEEGPDELMFSRIVGVLRLADGRLVVADGGSSQLRFFDPEGEFLLAAGRTGQGPGEFEYLFDLRRCGADFLYAFEIPWTANRFALDGEFVDSFVLEISAGGPPYSFACNDAGQFLALSWGMPLRGSGFFRSYGQLELLDASGASIAQLGEFPVSERMGHSAGVGPHPYGKQTVLALNAANAYVGTADTQELHRIELTTHAGSQVAIGSGAPSMDLHSDEVDRFRAWTAEHSEPEWANWWIEQFKVLEFPDSIPAYTQLVVDETGALWLRDFEREWDEVERWRVYSPDGELLAALELPLRFQVHEIGDDYLIGVWTDEIGTEYVQLLELSRSSPAAADSPAAGPLNR